MYFDFLKSIKLNNNNNNSVIIAPTWINKEKNLFEDYSITIIDNLLKNNFKVILRPHPEHFKVSKKKN